MSLNSLQGGTVGRTTDRTCDHICDLSWIAPLVSTRLVTRFGGYSSRPTQPGHPSMGRCNEHWRWIQTPLRKFSVAVGPVTSTAGILAYCVLKLKFFGLTLAIPQVKGDELPPDRTHRLCVNLLFLVLTMRRCSKQTDETRVKYRIQGNSNNTFLVWLWLDADVNKLLDLRFEVTVSIPAAALSSATLCKLFTHICLCHRAVQLGSSISCGGWGGGDTLAHVHCCMQLRLVSGRGPQNRRSAPRYAPHGSGRILLFLLVLLSNYKIRYTFMGRTSLSSYEL